MWSTARGHRNRDRGASKMSRKEKRASSDPALPPSAMRTAEFFTERGAQADIEAARRILRRQGGQAPEPEDRLE